MRTQWMTTFAAATLVTGLQLATSLASANDDAYLREIRAEGEKTERLDRAREEIRRSEEQERENKDNKSAKPAPVASSQATFESQLHRDSPASYKIYTGFTPEKRGMIFKTYLKDRKMSVVKRKIVDTYLGI